MKNCIINLLVSTLFLLSLTSSLSAQGIKGGKVEYEQFNFFEFEERPDMPEWKELINSLPSQTKDLMMLLFDQDASLYQQSNITGDVMNEWAKKGIAQYEEFQPPKPKPKVTYNDFKGGELTTQVSFMSRFFILQSKTKTQPWKIGAKQVEILGYTCKEATLKKAGETITAWFTTDIPVSAGPLDYEGLPGLILAVEVNGRNAILATDVDLTFQADGGITKPKEGMKVKEKQFESIMEEKIKEWMAAGGPRGALRTGKK